MDEAYDTYAADDDDDNDDGNDDYYIQINTDPMQSQLAYLDIVEPSILSTDTSADQRVGLDTSASWSYLELSRAN